MPFRTYPGTHPNKGAFFTRGSSRNAQARYSELGEDYVYNMERLRQKFETILEGRDAFYVAHVVHSYRAVDMVEVLVERRVPFVVTFTDLFSICHRLNLVRTEGGICAGPRGGKNCEAFCADARLAPDDYPNRLDRLRLCLEKASALVAVSEFFARAIREEHPQLEIKVISNGIDLLRFAGRSPPAKPKASITFGYLGTVSEAKGATVLARAFAKAAPANARLRIVGPCYDDAIRAEILSCGAYPQISLEGPVEAAAVPDALAQFDVLCVPSQVPEAYSLALHEGFAAGLPALVSDLGNIADVVRRHDCGQVVGAADIEGWASAIGMVARDTARIQAWSRNLPLPFRVEEEGFLYVQLYRAVQAAGASSAKGRRAA